MVRRRAVGARLHRVVDGATKAHIGAKYFSPVQPWCGGKLGRAPRFMAWPCLTVGQIDIVGTRTGEKYFAPTHAARGYIGRAPRFMAWRCLMVGRLRTDGTRTGEIFFAPTHAVRGYIGRAPRFMAWRLLIPGRLRMGGARGAKNISPAHSWCVVKLGGCHDLWCGHV